MMGHHCPRGTLKLPSNKKLIRIHDRPDHILQSGPAILGPIHIFRHLFLFGFTGGSGESGPVQIRKEFVRGLITADGSINSIPMAGDQFRHHFATDHFKCLCQRCFICPFALAGLKSIWPTKQSQETVTAFRFGVTEFSVANTDQLHSSRSLRMSSKRRCGFQYATDGVEWELYLDAASGELLRIERDD